MDIGYRLKLFVYFYNKINNRSALIYPFLNIEYVNTFLVLSDYRIFLNTFHTRSLLHL